MMADGSAERCPRCGAEVSVRWKHCPECGGSLSGSRTPPGATVGGDASIDAGSSGWRGGVASGELIGGKYEIQEEVARGGMGVVYRARHVKLDRVEALKRVLLDDEGSVRRFLEEARCAARLRHPGIVRVYDYGEDGEGPWYTMEYVEGGRTLRGRLEKEGRLSVAEGRALGLWLCEVLGYAHGEGVIHRDVKPSNILIERDGRWKLGDFGLARRGEGIGLSLLGRGMGTLEYAAREQREGRKVDHRADIYSVGATLYHVVTGSRPSVIRETLIPEGFREVLLRSVSEDPRDRYFSMGDFAGELRGLSAGAPRVRVEEREPARGRSAEPVVEGFSYQGESPQGMHEYIHDRTGLVFVHIPGGTFVMGSPESEPERDADERQHKVTLSPYLIGKYALTQSVWEKVMGDNPSHFKKGGDYPVEEVSWDMAKSFCKKVGLDLPTEAQWEYACRAGTRTPFAFGETITPEQVNYDGNYPYGNASRGRYREETVPVDSFEPNGWGLYNMHGNVWEWCSDWYGDYPRGSVTDPRGPSSGSIRVSRGGSWFILARYCRSADRYCYDPSGSYSVLGFRPARSLR